MNQQRLFFGAAVTAVFIIGLAAALDVQQRASYQETTGLVTSVELAQLPHEVTQLGEGIVPQLSQATVNYEVASQQYELVYQRPAPAYQYVFGETLAVYYDQDDPANAVLAPADLAIGNRALLLSFAGLTGMYPLLANQEPAKKKRR